MKHIREILAIAIPAIVSNITTPILSLVDMAITGHIGDAVYIGAIAIGGTMFNIIYWIFNFLRMGTSGLTAQAFGAQDNKNQSLILYRALTIGFVIAGLLLIFSRPICSIIISFMDTDSTTASLAQKYFLIGIIGAPAVMATYALSGWFLGMQDSRSTMWMAIITNIINICVSLLLVIVLGWKIEGVATGTVIAQWVGMIFGLYIIKNKYSIQLSDFREIFEWQKLRRFFRISFDIFLRTLCLAGVTLWFTHAGVIQGVDILAANALLLQLFMLFSFFMDGFAFSGEALAGKYLGMCDLTNLKSMIKQLMLIGLGCALIFGSIYSLAGNFILNLLAEDATVISIALQYLPWAVIVPLTGFTAFVWDGIFVGLTRTRALLSSMFVAMIIFFGIYFVSNKYIPALGNSALWLAFNLYLLTRGCVQSFLFKQYQHTL